MTAGLLVRLNVCKSWACPNLGVPDAPDYQQPVYRLGYPALHCARCGSLPPLFNEPLFNGWFRRFLAQKLKHSGAGCPHCASPETIRYGVTQTGHPRLQCCACRKIFTPWLPGDNARLKIQTYLKALARGEAGCDRASYRTLAQAAAWCEARLVAHAGRVAHIATQTFTVPVLGEHPQQPLYVVLSADIVTGQVLQLSSSYCAWKPHDALRYHGDDADRATLTLCGEQRVREQEALFMRRSQFDDIRYGDAALCRNDPGALLRPSVVIHGHFQWLRRRFPAVISHSLAHECVLRGAAITAWASQVSAGKTQLRFVVEEALDETAAGGTYIHRGSWRIGWWNNLWQQWENGATRKMIGMLTGEEYVGDTSTISLAACTAFIGWLGRQPVTARWGYHRAGVVSQQLVCLAYRYNQQLLAQCD
ncbi:IS1/IS1595 family N-terminal zinc-binding domain-containing protein [Cronobacter dublinensis]|uniref:IS1/IS1595 family N-terminal zinc-binding domain-containing protein n=1 Tax=Cronobacter dublinensis TaxID=413497 RepID=UPI0006BC133F|nr:hypothetical protein [Cronobacter dublinensis]ALB67330.1 hypothetical protein AFK67_12895 [Cronobacter dublinensis subsp. dublinensis LMG 23823]MDI7270615.1 hypothetical protein [Cronobacter dublinensis]